MGNQHSKCDDCYKTHLPENHDRTILPSEAFSEWYVPEFNQASEGELRAIIERYVDRTAVLAKQDGTSFNNKHLLKLDMATAIEAIIRTEKLKLLAEVRSNLLEMRELKENRDNKGILWGSYDVVDLDDIQGLLTKLEAEL